MGTNKRKFYSPEYRQEAARRVIDTGRSTAEVARELNIPEPSLRKWVRAEREVVAGPPSLSLDERAELKQLRKEVADLRKDNEFLGKAAAFFASKQHL